MTPVLATVVVHMISKFVFITQTGWAEKRIKGSLNNLDYGAKVVQTLHNGKFSTIDTVSMSRVLTIL